MTYYLIVLLTQAPWLLLLAGAVLRIRHHGGRLRRLQLEGTLLLLGGMVAALVMYDPHVGLDRYRTFSWGLFFDRAENAAFWIGILFFALGYFLERRPRPGLRTWPVAGKAISAIAILAFGLLGLAVNQNISLPWIDLPWPLGRLVFGLGCYPFAIGYLVSSRHPTAPPPGE
jgi:hypothetical protein